MDTLGLLVLMLVTVLYGMWSVWSIFPAPGKNYDRIEPPVYTTVGIVLLSLLVYEFWPIGLLVAIGLIIYGVLYRRWPHYAPPTKFVGW